MENIISSPEFKTRIIDLEYKYFSPENLEKHSVEDSYKLFEEDFKKIYLEETGELFEGEVNLYHSSELEEDIIYKSGYDGTAIQLNNGDSEELYVVSQGTQDLVDWEYNIKSMFAGDSADQAIATDRFVEETIKNLDINNNTEIHGLSHSLAHNNNTTALLAFDTFDQVYSVNGAQTNYYQLYGIDYTFRLAVEEKFNIVSKDELYELPPQELHDFTMDFYEDKSNKIEQYISYDDPLYAVSGVRGFFTLGDVTHIDTNPDLPGLREMVDEIPDEAIVSLQEVAIDYTIASEKGGMNAGIEELLGVNPTIFDGKDSAWDYLTWYITSPGEVDTMIRNLNENVPVLNEKIQMITDNSEVIFGRLYKAGYITEEQKDVLLTEFGNMQHELNEIQDLLEDNIAVRDIAYRRNMVLGADAGSLYRIYKHYQSFQDIFKRIDDSNVSDNLKAIIDSHGLLEMLSGMNDGNKSYLGTDMVLTSTKGGKIQINISAALRMYQQGFPLLEEKFTMIDNLEKAVTDEIETAFKEEKQKVVAEIDQMESSPGLHRSLLRKHVYFNRLDKTVRKIDVHEKFLPLEQADLDAEIQLLRESVEKGKKHIETYRKSVEDLFEKEDHVSDMFELLGRL